jgi:hypothetical protein
VSNRLNQAFGRKSCAVMAYFVLVKTILSDSKVARSKKTEVAHIVLNRVIKDDDERTPLITLLTKFGLVKTAIEEKALTVSDPLYLKIGELASSMDRFAEEMNERNRNVGMECTDPAKCEAKANRAWYENLRQELSGTRPFAREFLWLAKRIK